MRASLASATSLLALLLAEGHSARAAAIFSTANPLLAFGDGLVSTKGSGSSGVTLTGTTASSSASASPFGGTPVSFTTQSKSVAYWLDFRFAPLSTGAAIPRTLLLTDSGRDSLTLTGTGVAPLETITTSNPYLPVGSSEAIGLNVANMGNGNTSGQGTSGNPRGSVGSASSIFNGAGGAFSLQDRTATAEAAATQSLAYRYTPTSKGAVAGSTPVTTLNDGVGNTDSAGTVTTTPTGVAPVGVVSTSTSSYVLVGQTGTSSITVSDTGNLAGLGTIGKPGDGRSAPGTAAFSLGDSTPPVTPRSAVSKLIFAPSVKGTTASAMGVAALSNGAGTANSTSATTYNLTGTDVAPVEPVTGVAANSIRVGTTKTSTITIASTGNLSGHGSISRLNGSISTTPGAGVTANGGNATSVSRNDVASSTLAYSYAPISRGSVASTATTAFGNATGTSASQSVSSVFVNRAVGPVYPRSVPGAGAADPPVAVAEGSVGAASPRISFGSVGYDKSVTIYLDLQNIMADRGGSLTNRSIEQYSISGANAGLFAATRTAGSASTEGGELLVPITVTDNNRSGVLNSSLTIFTDEAAALGGSGDTFTYALTALSVPEPASIAVLGAGLAGLAGLRRRRLGVAARNRNVANAQ